MLARIIAIAAIVGLPALAQADPQITVDQIKQHFSKGISCDGETCLPKGKKRAVCIGTDSKCEAEKAAADPGAFDMLITFELGSDRLSPQARENLEVFAKALQGRELANATFSIDGHTDARGSSAYNQDLSERRAAAVVDYLESLGISRDRLKAKGHGEESLRVDDPFAAINRRVEASLRIQ